MINLFTPGHNRFSHNTNWQGGGSRRPLTTTGQQGQNSTTSFQAAEEFGAELEQAAAPKERSQVIPQATPQMMAGNWWAHPAYLKMAGQSV